jgi:hypothetical protein
MSTVAAIRFPVIGLSFSSRSTGRSRRVATSGAA